MQYLQDYLSVLPNFDRAEVEKIIQENMELFEVKVLSKEEFEALIQQLATRQEQVTKLEPTGEKMDAEHFNNMHSNVALDLGRIYKSHLLVEKVIANYDRILQGSLDEIEKEINTLTTRIEELNLKAKGEDGLIVKTYGFEEADKSEHMETDTKSFAHLFTDRDGTTILPQAELNRSFHQHFLSLPLQVKEDAMHDSSGKVTAKIELMYEPPNAISDANHPLSYAIDDSAESYWYQVVQSKAPAYTEISKL